jgi:hypothetical protein
MVVLLCLLGSCSNTDIESVKQEVIEAIENLTQDDEAAAYEGTPVTKNGEEAPAAGKKPDASSPDAGAGNPPAGGTPDNDPQNGDPPKPPANVPSLRINELRTEYRKFGSYFRAEFIEFKMLSAGNLGGLRVFIASNYNNPLVYTFKPVEVKEGEYVVLHLSTFEEEKEFCIDEYGEDLSESGGTESCSKARDFWIPGETELLGKIDAIYIMDQDNRVLDAVMIIENTGGTWPNNWIYEAAVLLSNGAWKSATGTIPIPADAVDSSDSSITRTVSRDENAEDTNTKADWYVSVSNGFTPGMENSPRPK